MPNARTYSVALNGMQGRLVEISADIAAGSPHTSDLGPPAAGLRETNDRVRAAVRNSRYPWPDGHLTLQLSPDHLTPDSGHDLGIAVAVLAAAGHIPASALPGTVLLGELALDGRVRPVPAVLASVLAARELGMRRMVVPAESLAEATAVDGIDVRGAGCLSEVIAWLRQDRPLPSRPGDTPATDPPSPELPDVLGQPEACRALEVAAAGGHHLQLVGPARSGRILLARRLPWLLPPLSAEEALEVAAIHSIDGSLTSGASPVPVPRLVAPHHSSSMATLLGGGPGLAKPGAVSKAHLGVLLLDEASEFSSRLLEALRAVLDDSQVRLATARGVVTYPARCQLVLASGACPCRATRSTHCLCTPAARRRFQRRIPATLLDRIDVRVHLRPPAATHAPTSGAGEDPSTVRDRVAQARHRAARRWAGRGWRTNADVPGQEVREGFAPSAGAVDLLSRAIQRGTITVRGAEQALRVGWTFTDLGGLDRPGVDEIAAALEFRDPRPPAEGQRS